MAKATSRQYDPAATDKVRRLPVESSMPGTTLRTIPLRVFSAGGTLFDTPGLHLHHRTPHLLTPDENKALHPRKRLAPFVAPAPAEVAAAAAAAAGAGRADERGEALEGGAAVASYWWGGLVRIDVMECPADTRLVFYGPPALQVAAVPGASTAAPAAPGPAAGGEPFGAESVALRGGLRVAKVVSLRAGADVAEALADVAVSGVPGWVTVFARGGRGEGVRLRLLAPKGVEVYARPPLPVPSPLQ
jgi:nitric-oxide synthase